MNFEQEYQLEQFRKIQNQYFDKNDNCYTGVNLSPSMMEMMLSLINVLSERQAPTETKKQAGVLADVSNQKELLIAFGRKVASDMIRSDKIMNVEDSYEEFKSNL